MSTPTWRATAPPRVSRTPTARAAAQGDSPSATITRTSALTSVSDAADEERRAQDRHHDAIAGGAGSDPPLDGGDAEQLRPQQEEVVGDGREELAYRPPINRVRHDDFPSARLAPRTASTIAVNASPGTMPSDAG